MSSSLTVSLISVFWFVVRFILRRREHFKLFDRTGVPSIGNPRLFSGNLFDTFAQADSIFRIDRYHKQLGQTYGLFYGPDPWVMSTDLELLRRVFITEGQVHINQTQFKLPFATEFNESLAQVRGDKWRQTRRIMAPSFTHRQMQTDNVYRDIEQVCEQMIHYIDAHMRDGYHLGHQVASVMEAHYAFKKYSLEVISRIAFGRPHKVDWKPHEPVDELIDLVDRGAKVISCPVIYLSIMFNSTQRLLSPLVGLTCLGQLFRHVHRIMDASIAWRRSCKTTSQVDPSGGLIQHKDRKMIDSLIESFDSGQMDEQSLRANLFFMLIAGHETSSITLTLLCWHLAWHQQVQEKLRQSVMSESAPGASTSNYLDWCIKETIRLFPPVPTSIGRVLEHDIEHEGMKFRKGTTVNASIWSIHRCREYWGPDVDEFRPERFEELETPRSSLGGRSNSSQQQRQQQQQQAAAAAAAMRFFGFAHGPRYCIGQNLAMAEIRAAVAKIVTRYKVVACPTTPREIRCRTPNMIQLMIEHPVELAFVSLTTI